MIAVFGTGFYFATTTGLWVSNSSGASGSFTLKGTADGLGSAYLYDVAIDGNGKDEPGRHRHTPQPRSVFDVNMLRAGPLRVRYPATHANQ